MEIKRTANAGVLITLDGVSLLLDGICGEIKPYIKTPDNIREELYENLPDMVAFTHTHTDHFDKEYASFFEEKTSKSIVYPRGVSEAQVGNLKIRAIKSRHIGMFDIRHFSFVINGSKTVWFMGDAAPVTIKNMVDYQIPDVLCVPFSYLSTEFALRLTKNTKAKEIILLHMPEKEGDGKVIWETVEGFIKGEKNIHIPKVGESLVFNFD